MYTIYTWWDHTGALINNYESNMYIVTDMTMWQQLNISRPQLFQWSLPMHILIIYTRPTSCTQYYEHKHNVMASACVLVCHALSHGGIAPHPHIFTLIVSIITIGMQLRIVCTNAGGPHFFAPIHGKLLRIGLYTTAWMAIDGIIKLQHTY